MTTIDTSKAEAWVKDRQEPEYRSTELQRHELRTGRTYRGKKPRPVTRGFDRLVNDRTVIWIGAYELQYDGPSVGNGARYPRASIDEFLAWADRDVTDELPAGEYATWPITKNTTKE